MKKTLALLSFLIISITVNAQLETPHASPFSKIEQKVGLTDITLEYSRPSMRGRTIFGDLVSYGKVWRTGANANTKITFGDDVVVNGKTLKAGSYAVYTIPNENSWDVLLYSDANNWGTPREWDETKVAAKVTVEIYPMPVAIETFTMSFDDLTNNSVMLGILWEKVYTAIRIEVPTDTKTSKNIEKVLSGPAAADYYSAAVYYLQEGKDVKQAKEWIDKAVMLTKDNPRFWYLRQQSLIYAKAGDKKGAIEAAKKSLVGAEAAGNVDYIKLNKDSLKEWGVN